MPRSNKATDVRALRYGPSKVHRALVNRVRDMDARNEMLEEAWNCAVVDVPSSCFLCGYFCECDLKGRE